MQNKSEFGFDTSYLLDTEGQILRKRVSDLASLGYSFLI